MPKTSKKKKKEKTADFQKVKLKLGKKKPTAENFTDTSFKAKSIVLLSQNFHEESETNLPTFNNKTFSEFFVKARHYNANVRKDAIIGLNELLKSNISIIKLELEKLFNLSSKNIIDADHYVRKSNLDLVKLIYNNSNRKSSHPFISLHITYTLAGLSHIQEDIRSDAFKVLNLLIENVPEVLKLYAQNTRNEILISLLNYLRILFGSSSSDSKAGNPSELKFQGQVSQENEYTIQNSSVFLIPSSETPFLLEETVIDDLNLFEGSFKSDTSSSNLTLNSKDTKWYDGADSFSKKSLCLNLLENIFPFLEATWIETAPSLFDITTQTSAAIKTSRGKKKAQNNLVDLNIISSTIEILLLLWTAIDDGTFLSDIFEFIYYKTKAGQKCSPKDLKSLNGYQQYSFLLNIMAYFPLGSGYRDQNSLGTETSVLLLNTNLKITNLISILNNNLSIQFNKHSLKFKELKVQTYLAELFQNMHTGTKNNTNRAIKYISKVLGVKSSLFLPDTKPVVHIKDDSKSSISSTMGNQQFSELLLSIDSFLKNSKEFSFSYPVYASWVNNNDGNSEYEQKYVSDTYDLKCFGIEQEVNMNEDDFKSQINTLFRDWVLNLPKLLWNLKQINHEASETILDILGYCFRSPARIFGLELEGYEKLKMTLIPIFYVFMPKSGELYGPFLEYPISLQRKVLELVYYAAREKPIEKLTSAVNKCFEKINSTVSESTSPENRTLSNSDVIRNFAFEILPMLSPNLA
ncbi:hypothetical protein BB560_001314 [Smittium megazygosporum]|uniref:Pre-rRNA-processing protein n=1 Tax=Smittium megazygosporum TaxID=133381 RepID=A0A2T9ZHY3_9FUNG|nr:hypothetical protein BB560_001314 [Smittium megazygosporum]